MQSFPFSESWRGDFFTYPIKGKQWLGIQNLYYRVVHLKSFEETVFKKRIIRLIIKRNKEFQYGYL